MADGIAKAEQTPRRTVALYRSSELVDHAGVPMAVEAAAGLADQASGDPSFGLRSNP